jgi:uncharacterized RDD family membrane protein YckC
MSVIKVTTTQNIELEFELASLGERMVAYLVDGAIIAGYYLSVVLILIGSQVMNRNEWLIFALLLPVFFYDLASEVFMNGQSVGKKVMNIKVISLSGESASVAQYLIRWLFRLVDFTLTFNLCALISIAVSERHQRVGDMVAGTTLIKTRPRSSLQHTIYTPVVTENYTVTFPEVSNLSSRDVQLVKEVIMSVNQSGNIMLARHAADKIKEVLHIQSDMEARTFLLLLLSDYNYLTSME